jgi:hypothetical protein
VVSQVPGGLGEIIVIQAISQSDGKVPVAGHHPWCLAVAHLVIVLLDEDITPPMETVFYANGREPSLPTGQDIRVICMAWVVTETFSEAQGGVFDGADDLPAVALVRTTIGNLLPRST